MRVLVAVSAVAMVACTWGSRPAAAQQPDLPVLDSMFNLSVAPPRPPLASLATLDSNDAREYYDVGMASVDTNHALASAAFYWASRLDPAWADPYFARWYVLRRAEPRAMSDSVRQRVDSLYGMALMYDPFVDEQISFTVEARSERRVPRWWFLYSGRRYDLASQELARVIPKYPNILDFYIYRAKAAYYLGQYDTAAAILASALDRGATWDTTRMHHWHFQRSVLAYAMGVAYQYGHRDSLAATTFLETLSEKPGFYMAALHLAMEFRSREDTAMALHAALDAALTRPDDAAVQLFFGMMLLDLNHPGDAIGPLRAAIAADPYFALPHYYLGQACELVHDNDAAIAGYRGYLARAKHRDALRESAEHALVRINGT